MKKKKPGRRIVIGELQVTLGIVLLIGGILGLIISHNWYTSSLNQNVGGFKSYVNTIQANILSNETRYLGVLGVYNYYVEKESRIGQIFITLDLTFVMITIFSLLFITQGLVNLSKIEK